MRFLPILMLLAAGLCMAQAPAYQSYLYMECAGAQIDVGYYGAPCIANWSDDVNKDMILGVFTGGRIRFYANENTNDSPVFNSYSNLKADGTTITLPSG
ncbi:MAG: hypothetical protein KAR40_00550 [Candidatus Sabulitectum sp.]|nr:hypothetical protein [Candidatus Sabulitectum sp.]